MKKTEDNREKIIMDGASAARMEAQIGQKPKKETIQKETGGGLRRRWMRDGMVRSGI